MNMSNIGLALASVDIDDIRVPGFIDVSEKPARFYPLFRAIYFECQGTLIRFGAIGDSGRMLVAQAETITVDVELDEEMLPACSSLREMVLRDPDGPNKVAAVHLWDGRDTTGGLECAAVRFDIMNGQQIFLDPSYYFGIRLGGSEQQSIWSENLLNSELRSVEVRRKGAA